MSPDDPVRSDMVRTRGPVLFVACAAGIGGLSALGTAVYYAPEFVTERGFVAALTTAGVLGVLAILNLGPPWLLFRAAVLGFRGNVVGQARTLVAFWWLAALQALGLGILFLSWVTMVMVGAL